MNTSGSEQSEVCINTDFIKECNDDFYKDPCNIIARNSVVAIGSLISTTDSNRLNNIDHVFMNSLKKKNLKCTNQGRTGRCWQFSALNMFRHNVIKALQLDNFEFSETYLFFWDKFERSNTYINWFINNPNTKPEDDSFKFIVDDFISDGGWWNMFSNLVKKYGLIPKTAMKETFQSDDSEDMNQILNNKIQSCANYLFNNKRLTPAEIEAERQSTLKQIYSILVKFLGEPPTSGFKWCYTNDDDVSTIIADLKPNQFMDMVMPSIDIDDFVVLTHLPGKLKYKKMYEIQNTSNTHEGSNFKFLNLPITELSKYASLSILGGMPVWFAADVSKDFNPYHSILDDKLLDEDRVFGSNHEFTKGDRITFRNLSANHAMSLIGINLSVDGKPDSWQVENSWGYCDNETPGLDGFLYMSHSWFNKNVMQIVVHKNFLSRTIKKLLKQKPELLDAWNCVAPACKIRPSLHANRRLVVQDIHCNKRRRV